MNEKILKGIKYCREQRGMTIEDLANESGISKSYLLHLENGQRTNPSLNTLTKICEALNMEISFVFIN